MKVVRLIRSWLPRTTCQAESSLVTGDFEMKGDEPTHRSLELFKEGFIASF